MPNLLKVCFIIKLLAGTSSNVANNPACEGLYSFIQFKASAVCFTNPLKTGRYVGIMTTKEQVLQLCEVEIYSRGISINIKVLIKSIIPVDYNK